MRDVHPALLHATVVTKIPMVRTWDFLEDHILSLQDFIDKETLNGSQYSKKCFLDRVLDSASFHQTSDEV